MRHDCLAMILAGGSGSRLMPLTKRLAKPAVLFGGKYRIIDFALSNCINSGIDTMGVLVQYKPLSINECVYSNPLYKDGTRTGTITLLPPHMHENGGSWYKGTANAVYQNMEYIEKYDPQYVIILSADQIYKMDYSLMLEFHKKTGAELTVATTTVSKSEAHRFGILKADSSSRIFDFEEKPKKPMSNLASMGIYIFNCDLLIKALENDMKDVTSCNDFGRNIIPSLVRGMNTKVYSYRFDGYWRDVGTVKSFWEANMDLLEENNGLNLHDPSWKIHSEITPMPPVYINHTARVNTSIIGDGCYIQGTVDNSVLFPGVFVGRNAVVIDSVVMSNAIIEPDTYVARAIIGSNAVVKSFSRIEGQAGFQDEIAYLEENCIFENLFNLQEVAVV